MNYPRARKADLLRAADEASPSTVAETHLSRNFDSDAFTPSSSYYFLSGVIRGLLDLNCPDVRMMRPGDSPCLVEYFPTYQALRAHLLKHDGSLTVYQYSGWPSWDKKYERDYVIALLDRLYVYNRHNGAQQDEDVEYLMMKLDVPLEILNKIVFRRKKSRLWL